MAKNDQLVECSHGHGGLTVCPACNGSGHVAAGEPGAPAWAKRGESGGAAGKHHHCQTCRGSGLLEPHPLSCFG